jgi:hypothetical protein
MLISMVSLLLLGLINVQLRQYCKPHQVCCRLLLHCLHCLPPPLLMTSSLALAPTQNLIYSQWWLIVHIFHIFLKSFTHIFERQVIHFPNLPDKWTRIMYHAYNDVYSSIGINLPHIPASSSVPGAIHRARSYPSTSWLLLLFHPYLGIRVCVSSLDWQSQVCPDYKGL